jgi:hypothetical protein
MPILIDLLGRNDRVRGDLLVDPVNVQDNALGQQHHQGGIHPGSRSGQAYTKRPASNVDKLNARGYGW